MYYPITLNQSPGFYLYKWLGPPACTGELTSIWAHGFDLHLLSTGNHVTMLQNTAAHLITGTRKWASISTHQSSSSPVCQPTRQLCLFTYEETVWQPQLRCSRNPSLKQPHCKCHDLDPRSSTGYLICIKRLDFNRRYMVMSVCVWSRVYQRSCPPPLPYGTRVSVTWITCKMSRDTVRRVSFTVTCTCTCRMMGW